MLIKGAQGVAFLSDEAKDFIKLNTWTIIGYSFIGWTILLALLQFLAKVNILKVIVLVGTFALAMAFAGNDLVNFIGVPLAGLKSFQLWSGSGVDPSSFSMEVLAEKVNTPTLYLLIAGIIMVITLWVSKKARTVTATELNLSKQDAGFEKYASSTFSRFIVRQSIKVSNAISYIVPDKITEAVQKRFTAKPIEESDSGSAFDLVRASVNLTVASILISFATSYKLPLSTTYVTFMVAMGTSLADGAWGRESAVYRVSGVTTVIGGWFFTAFIAFTAAFIIALLVSWTNFWAVPVLLIIAIFIIVKSGKAHKEREGDDEKILKYEKEEVEEIDIMARCSTNVVNTLTRASDLFEKILNFVTIEDRKKLKKTNKEVEKLNKTTKNLKDSVDAVIVELQEDSIETGHHYVQVTDYLREIAHSLTYISRPVFEHFDNQHTGFTKEQNKELTEINKQIQGLFKSLLKIIHNNKFENIEEPIKFQQSILDLLQKIRKNQIKRIKQAEVGTKNSILFLNVVAESKNLTLFTINLIKAHRDFVIYQNNGIKTLNILD
ncbi:MAG: inorganic phosphate transporter [Bacteroidales bacterium]|nr:inorganic phosphate transporter [Bacteroidales bacterium]